jgi:hypothetical protein
MYKFNELILKLTFDEILYWQLFLKKIRRTSGPEREAAFNAI